MNILKIDQKDYEVIEFIDKRPFRSPGEPKTRRAAKVGSHLAVTPDRVYRLDTFMPLLDVMFASLEDGIKFAEWINDLFGDYFDIWSEYPDADVFSMAKWSVKSGLQAYETIKIIRDKNVVSQEEVRNAWKQSLEASSHWTEQLGRNSGETRSSQKV